MIKKCTDRDSIISRKDVDVVLTRYMKFIPKKMRRNIMNDMVGLKLIERVNRDKIKIINKEMSEIIEHDLFLSDIDNVDGWW